MHLEKLVLILSVVTCVLSSKFLDQEWEAWKAEHGKKYMDSHDEMFRRKVWEATWEKVQKHNELASQGLSRYRMAVNMFADMTPEERDSMKCFISNKKSTSQSNIPERSYPRGINLPKSVDWRKSNCVTPVKYQGFCGSCWAFATVGVFESIHCIHKNKKLVEFSEQQLVDCDYSNGACHGGFPVKAMAYVTRYGIMKAEDYKYSARQMGCLFRCDKAVTFNVTQYYTLTGEVDIAMSVAFNGPVAVLIDASDDFKAYKSGIFDGGCSTKLTHAVLAVGYGSERDKASNQIIDYWIIKNSWGERWGDNGYVKMKRNVNLCGIATAASSVDIAN